MDRFNIVCLSGDTSWRLFTFLLSMLNTRTHAHSLDLKVCQESRKIFAVPSPFLAEQLMPWKLTLHLVSNELIALSLRHLVM